MVVKYSYRGTFYDAEVTVDGDVTALVELEQECIVLQYEAHGLSINENTLHTSGSCCSLILRRENGLYSKFWIGPYIILEIALSHKVGVKLYPEIYKQTH